MAFLCTIYKETLCCKKSCFIFFSVMAIWCKNICFTLISVTAFLHVFIYNLLSNIILQKFIFFNNLCLFMPNLHQYQWDVVDFIITSQIWIISVCSLYVYQKNSYEKHSSRKIKFWYFFVSRHELWLNELCS